MNDIARATPGTLTLHQVDVFSQRASQWQRAGGRDRRASRERRDDVPIAQELRQFETIFLSEVTTGGAEARIFTPEGGA